LTYFKIINATENFNAEKYKNLNIGYLKQILVITAGIFFRHIWGTVSENSSMPKFMTVIWI